MMKEHLKVLVVDDDPNVRKTLSDILRIKGYEVTTAEDGVTGIAEADRAFINVALIDLKLPDMSGIEVMERIKAASALTEAIILTGHAALDTAIEATNKGAFSYLLKPYEIEDLLLHLRHAVERQRAREEIGRLASYPRMSPDPIIEIDADGAITYLNPAAEQLFPDLVSAGAGHPLLDGVVEMFAGFRHGGPQKTVHEIEVGGTSYEQRIYYVPESDLIRVTALDITERKAAEERIRTLAFYDTLTGLPNRTLIRDRITTAIAAAHRRHARLAVLFLDIDRFESFNDSLGLHVGDLLLAAVASRLKEGIREGDSLARVGGDEFVILLQDIEKAGDVDNTVQRIRAAMAEAFHILDHRLVVTCSIGIGLYPEHGKDADTLVRNADTAMHVAKADGRGGVRVFTPEMNALSAETLSLEHELRQALENDELVLHYQPQLDLATNALVGFEALTRWLHPVRGMVAPDRFIPVAEKSGLIVQIGEQVLRKACIQARQWQEQGLPRVPVAVNVSAVQFRQGGFMASVRGALRASALDPDCLELELTESLLLSDTESTLGMLDELRKMGLRLSIDDFGTGYSSLSYLKHFPVYKLKIDQSFVRDLPADADNAAIVGAIIGIATSLHMRVIAEGVETEQQLAFLRARGCDEIQGYFYSKPLPPDHAAAFLKAHGKP